jgi:hypothetical protein
VRKLAASLSVVAIAATLLLAGAAPAAVADTVTPPSGPVAEVPDLPSRTAVSVGTGTADGDMTAVKTWWAMRQWLAAHRGATIAEIPKVITGAAKPVEAAAPMVGFAVGWLLVQGGLQSYAIATGSSYQTLICSTTPDWYRFFNDQLTFGLVPSCKGTVTTPNADQSATLGVLTYAGVSASITASQYFSAWGQTSFCGVASTPGPPGYDFQVLSSAGGSWGSTGYPSSSSPGYECSHYWVGSTANGNLAFTLPGNVSVVGMRFVKVSDGSVGAQVTVGGGGNPSRLLSCKIGWTDGTTTTANGTTYTDQDGVPLDAASTGCATAYTSKPGAGPGLMPSSIEVDSDDGSSKTAISTTTVPSETAPQRASLTGGNGHGLVLSKLVGSALKSCNTWAADCSGWWSASSSGTDSTTYECTFGGAVVALSECGVYRYTFDTNTGTSTITDPATGSQVSWSNDPADSSSIDPSTPVDPQDTGQCLSDGWSSSPNPIEWVLVPIKCALQWAFVPSPAVVSGTGAQVTDAVDASIFGTIGTSAAAIGTAFAGIGTGCEGFTWSFQIPQGGTASGNILGACTEPMAGVAAVVHNVLGISLALTALLACIRYVASIVGFTGMGGSTSGVRFKDGGDE